LVSDRKVTNFENAKRGRGRAGPAAGTTREEESGAKVQEGIASALRNGFLGVDYQKIP